MTRLPALGSGVSARGFHSGLVITGKLERYSSEREPEAAIVNGFLVDRNSIELIDTSGPEPARVKVLRHAAELVTGDRNRSYGEPTQNFTDIATGWTVLLRGKLREDAVVDPGDTAAMMIWLKMVRRIASDSIDNWTDAAGYAGCGAEADIASGRVTE